MIAHRTTTAFFIANKNNATRRPTRVGKVPPKRDKATPRAHLKRRCTQKAHTEFGAIARYGQWTALIPLDSAATDSTTCGNSQTERTAMKQVRNAPSRNAIKQFRSGKPHGDRRPRRVSLKSTKTNGRPGVGPTTLQQAHRGSFRACWQAYCPQHTYGRRQTCGRSMLDTQLKEPCSTAETPRSTALRRDGPGVTLYQGQPKESHSTAV